MHPLQTAAVQDLGRLADPAGQEVEGSANRHNDALHQRRELAHEVVLPRGAEPDPDDGGSRGGDPLGEGDELVVVQVPPWRALHADAPGVGLEAALDQFGDTFRPAVQEVLDGVSDAEPRHVPDQAHTGPVAALSLVVADVSESLSLMKGMTSTPASRSMEMSASTTLFSPEGCADW
jgi:hypothetical protein